MARFPWKGAAALLVSLNAFDGADAWADPRCPKVDLRQVSDSVEYDPGDSAPFRSMKIGHGKAADGAIVLNFPGPALGSMDSHAMTTRVACVDDGLQVSVTLTRSADFAGGAKNVLWRPKLAITAVALQPDAHVSVVWTMRSTRGESLDAATTPPFDEQKYPLKLSSPLN